MSTKIDCQQFEIKALKERLERLQKRLRQHGCLDDDDDHDDGEKSRQAVAAARQIDTLSGFREAEETLEQRVDDIIKQPKSHFTRMMEAKGRAYLL